MFAGPGGVRLLSIPRYGSKHGFKTQEFIFHSNKRSRF